MTKNKKIENQRGVAHLVLIIGLVLVLVIGMAGYRVYKKGKDKQLENQTSQGAQNQPNGGSIDPNTTDPINKGKILSNYECSGSGSKPLTHAPMNIKDVGTIQPMGLMVGGHVTPVDHEYYYPLDQNSPIDTYPVYADADGAVVAIMKAPNGDHFNWWVTIAHSCTFLSNYNLITNISADLKAKLPKDWGPNNNGGIKIPIKSGDLIGYVGHQSLDFQVWNTEKNLKGLLNPIAYNNAEPWKINTVAPMDYFTSDVKSIILPKYIGSQKPLDGMIDYDEDGKAVGSWFLKGTNGYAGNGSPGGPGYWTGHLALAYFYLDPSVLEFSIGDYNGQATQFAVVGNAPDWKTITPSSGIVKYQLGSLIAVDSTGRGWSGGYAKGITAHAGAVQATVLLQMTGKQEMKVEVFPGKTAAQVSGFDSNAKVYDRGQNAHTVASTTAH